MANERASDPGFRPPRTRTGELPVSRDEAPERIDTGPTMKSRARLMVSVAFLLALPAMLLGALRASQAAEDVHLFAEAQSVADEARQLQVRIQQSRAALWRYEAEPNVDSARHLKAVLDDLARSMVDLEVHLERLYRVEALRPELEAWRGALGEEALLDADAPLRRMRAAVGRVRRAVDPLIDAQLQPQQRRQPLDSAALRRAHTALETVTRDAAALASNAEALTQRRAGAADSAVSNVGRDQIVLFLLLLFSFPLFLALAPAWMIAPLTRLRGVAQRIEKGKQVRDIVAVGDDEIADLTRSLRTAFRRLEENDRQKGSKIFEMRRLLRAVLGLVHDAVLVVNPDRKIAYANPAAAALLGRETHNLESCPVDEAAWSVTLQDSIERARKGDVDDKGLDVTIETLDGRVVTVHAQLGTVRDHEGNITRVVVVLRK